MNSKTAKVLSILSIVAGALGIFLSIIPFAVYVGIPLSIAGIVLGIISMIALRNCSEGESKTLAVIGLIAGVIGVVVGAPMCVCSSLCKQLLEYHP